MAIRAVCISLFTLAVSVFFLYYGQSGNATPIENKKEPESREFNPREIVQQFPFKEGSTMPAVDLKSHPSISPELEGDTHNELHIRDDILAYIEEATQGNEKARRAAIKYAYYQNQVYYHSLTSEEALAWNSKSNIACWCLAMAMPENWEPIGKQIEKFMNNTEQRQLHMRESGSHFFAWKVLTSGLTLDEETEKCKSGIY